MTIPTHYDEAAVTAYKQESHLDPDSTFPDCPGASLEAMRGNECPVCGLRFCAQCELAIGEPNLGNTICRCDEIREENNNDGFGHEPTTV